MESIREAIVKTMSLAAGTDREGTIERVRADVGLRGTNIWLLICSALLACIGLDTSSAAVIIGAMLISPLMAPILGIGVGVGINDRGLMRAATVSFGGATVASLLTATLYFLVTPLGELTPELQSRTTPTLLDVGVAFFGGVAGIVAGSRREKTVAIPGVAIATALMPPLCTAGFGLASGLPSVFFGALYLFFINAVCISLATYTVVQLLHFPHVEQPDPMVRVRLRRYITVALVVVLVPSAVILYDVVTEVRVRRRADRFVQQVAAGEHRVVFRWDLARDSGVYVPGRPRRTLTLYLAGEAMGAAERDSLADAMTNAGLPRVDLRVIQADPSEEHERLTADVTLRVLEAVRASAEAAAEQTAPVDSAAIPVPRLFADRLAASAILEEIRAFDSRVVSLALGAVTGPAADSVSSPRAAPDGTADSAVARARGPELVAVASLSTRARLAPAELNRIEEFLRRRTNAPGLRVLWTR